MNVVVEVHDDLPENSGFMVVSPGIDTLSVLVDRRVTAEHVNLTVAKLSSELRNAVLDQLAALGLIPTWRQLS